jgi:hypothetical protein
VSTAVSKRPRELEAERPPDWSPVLQPAAGDEGPALAGVVLRALVAGGVALVAWSQGHRLAAAVLLTVVVAVTAVCLRVPSVATRIDRATRALQRVAGRCLAVVLLGAVQVLVFTPLSLLLRLAGRDALALGSARDSPTFWRPFPERPGRPLHSRPFAYERMPGPFASRRRRRLYFLRLRAAAVLFVVAALADFGVGAAINRLTAGTPQKGLMRFPNAAAGRHEPWREAVGLDFGRLWAQRQYDPYLSWRTSHFDGRYVHVAGGIRRSYEAAGSGAKNAVRVFFFGGSSMLGAFQRDEHTIPSELARLAEVDGLRVRVVNYGQLGYVNAQDVRLLEKLVAGKSVPDLAVFYDGFNEITNQFQVAPRARPIHAPARPTNKRPRLTRRDDLSPLSALYDRWADVSALHQLARALGLRAARTPFGGPWKGDQRHRPEDRGTNAASTYARSVQAARRLADRYGFRAAFFWQPSIYTKHVVRGEQQMLGAFGRDPQAWRRATGVARSRLGPPVSDLSTGLDGVRAPVMYDLVHTNELGARMVAEALYTRLRPRLLELSRRQRG